MQTPPRSSRSTLGVNLRIVCGFHQVVCGPYPGAAGLERRHRGRLALPEMLSCHDAQNIKISISNDPLVAVGKSEVMHIECLCFMYVFMTCFLEAWQQTLQTCAPFSLQGGGPLLGHVTEGQPDQRGPLISDTANTVKAVASATVAKYNCQRKVYKYSFKCISQRLMFGSTAARWPKETQMHHNQCILSTREKKKNALSLMCRHFSKYHGSAISVANILHVIFISRCYYLYFRYSVLSLIMAFSI